MASFNPILPFEDLIKPISAFLSVQDTLLLQRAYTTAREAHQGQKRKSGEEYFIHCIEVAKILIDLHLDPQTIAAGLLHDVVEDTGVAISDIREAFGNEIANLVNGVTKIEHLPLGDTSERERDIEEAEFLRKTLLAMNEDVRVILIKLADRLHNMRTLGYLTREKQLRMANETMDIFAPLASRLGIWQMKWELEDLSFRYIEPERYKQIASMIDERRKDRENYISDIVDRIKSILASEGIEADVSGRSKHIFSIHKKMERKDVPYDKLFDIRAVRIIVKDNRTCYEVLGLVHALWKPITGEFDDYIAVPKDNFYQSLHTAVILEDGNTLEIQIRTRDMHIHAEFGIAAHWRYKEGGARNEVDETYERRIKHLREMLEIGSSYDDANEFIDVMKSEVFQDRVYVFTPKGDIIDLPKGSTPIDFAYMIHTDVGSHCRGAKVNGRLVPLDHQLEVGDRVEILTTKRGGPSRDWLNPNLGYVKTKRAAAKIRQWFRKQDRDKMIVLGREILDRELKRLGEEKLSHDFIAELLGFDKTDTLLEQLGFGDIQPQLIAAKILETDRKRQQEAELLEVIEAARNAPLPSQTTLSPDTVTVQGTGGMLTNLARCCNPVLGDEIIGYITRGRGVTIHRLDCPNIRSLPHDRMITVDWGRKATDHYPVPIVINAYDREGLMRDIGAAMAEEKINLNQVNIRTENGIATFQMVIEVEDASQLSRLLSKAERISNVIEAHRRSV